MKGPNHTPYIGVVGQDWGLKSKYYDSNYMNRHIAENKGNIETAVMLNIKQISALIKICFFH